LEQVTEQKSDNTKEQDRYKDTLNLPKTSFPMRANLLKSEPEYQERWENMQLYELIGQQEHPSGRFVFHDGPPYANGSIHIGHLLNKVLKDLVVRSKMMEGYDVPFVPGWDCHGLPIEHKVMRELGKAAQNLSSLEIRQRCHDYAAMYVDIQTRQLVRLGTLGDYKNPYITMDRNYEGAVIELFADLVEQGIVYRALKPVHWSVANRTALAEAELEYQDREDISVYVHFMLEDPGKLPTALNAPSDAAISLMIWTTTPWTLPANLAVAAGPNAEYALYRIEQNNRTAYTIIAEALAAQVFGAGKIEHYEMLGRCYGRELAAAQISYTQPLLERPAPLVLADYVTLSDGTGLVHTAPGHGAEDYQTGIREGLEIYCPVLGDGRYDDSVPEWLRGLDVWKANAEIVSYLQQKQLLFHQHKFVHSYPHDWRSKTPTIFRATEQWFIGVDLPIVRDQQSLRDKALVSAEQIQFIPEWGRNRLRGMLESRPDWCISRQRSWGLPIPAFHRKSDNQALLTPASVRAVARKVREQSADIWFKAPVAELLEYYDPNSDPQAPKWLKEEGKDGFAQLERGIDIFDVWFESGTSWHAVMRERNIGFPVALYLEGSDQHRGWFQLSLLPALGATGQSPFEALLTHGFMVAADGHKMSKSEGNAIEVDKLLNQYGADICRWWVSSLNYVNDIKVDWKFFKVSAEEYRKVRNTIRFFLGNLGDFDPSQHRRELTPDERYTLDAWAKQQLAQIISNALENYDTYQFRRVNKEIFDYCNDSLSAIYLAAIKDRLYCEKVDSDRRRRTQTVLFDIAQALIRLIAPVLVHTAEEAYLSLKGLDLNALDCSIHLEQFPAAMPVNIDTGWDEVMALRSRVLKSLEVAKEQRGINYPLDAGIEVTTTPQIYAQLLPYSPELDDLCGVSRFALKLGESEQIEVQDLREEPRCQRSWKRDGTVRLRSDGGMLSDRDARALDLE
jgi:isoleucyl-tRNA synthetase